MVRGATTLANYGKAQQTYILEIVINDVFSFY